MAIRCSACRGQKKIKGLGSMLKKCETCNGVGYVDDNAETVQDEQLLEDGLNVEEKPKRKGNPNWRKKDASE